MKSKPSLILRLALKTKIITDFKKFFLMSEREMEKYVHDHLRGDLKLPLKWVSKHFIKEEKYFLNNLCLFLKPRSGYKKILYYTHGGAYIMNLFSIQLRQIGKLALKTQSMLVIPIYPLCPEHYCLDVFKMLMPVYEEILLINKEKYPINIIGDSAGGGIALSLALYVKKQKMPTFSNIILISPSLDMTPISTATAEEIEEMKKIEKTDPMISYKGFDIISKWWCRKYARDSILVSPIYGDFKGIGKISLLTGTNDLLNILAHRFLKVVNEQKVDINWIERPGLPHCYFFFFITREGRRAFKEVVDIINK